MLNIHTYTHTHTHTHTHIYTHTHTHTQGSSQLIVEKMMEVRDGGNSDEYGYEDEKFEVSYAGS